MQNSHSVHTNPIAAAHASPKVVIDCSAPAEQTTQSVLKRLRMESWLFSQSSSSSRSSEVVVVVVAIVIMVAVVVGVVYSRTRSQQRQN